jgi:DNA-3-methyladenine glycosylase II
MKFRLYPKAPYDFPLSINFIAKTNGKPLPYIWDGTVLRQAFMIDEEVYPMKVKSIGSVAKPLLEAQSISGGTEQRVVEFLNIDYDLRPLYAFIEKDPVLSPLIETLYGFKSPRMGSTVYEVIVKAIVQQQISLEVANHMTSLIIKKFGTSVKFDNDLYWSFPRPAILAKALIEDLKKFGLSRRKAEYVRAFSKAVIEGFNPENLREKEPEEIVEILTAFRGIGKWTAELVVVASMEKEKGEQIPADDLGLRRAVSQCYFDGKLQSASVIREIAKGWGKYSTVIETYLLYNSRSIKK